MPRVKVDYVVSFSSEDPDNPASNLLAWDVSKKRWLCAKGESSCSVVLQLPRAVKISAVQIGAHHAALVEVLVGRSEKPNEPFEVLVPSCIFLTPAESRKDSGVERVRSFAADQLSAAACQRWDRVRLVCSQPFNKHCKYGLNFVHITETEGAAPAPAPADAGAASGPAGAPGPRAGALWRDPGSSSDDEFHPGELFAKHKSPPADTGAQIRQATSQALRNISDSATKLVKTLIPKPTVPPTHTNSRQTRPDACVSDRQRDGLMYTDDDDRPHSKIDLIMKRHKEEKSRDEARKQMERKHERKPSNDAKEKKDKNEDSKRKHERKSSNDTKEKKEDSQSQSDRHKDRNERKPTDEKYRPEPLSKDSRDEQSTSGSHQDKSDKDTNRSRDDQQADTGGCEFASILRGVVFVLSGYANPQRASIRDKALEMGARCERGWGPRCTHLICAFPNTPKLNKLRSEPGGARVPAARGEWVEECHRLRRRLPWRWYATEPAHAAAPAERDDECDTDDEIEKALRKQKKRRTEPSPSSSKDQNDAGESSKRVKYDTEATNDSQNRHANVSNTSRDNGENAKNTSHNRHDGASKTSRDSDANAKTAAKNRHENGSHTSRDSDANARNTSQNRHENSSKTSRDSDANTKTTSKNLPANESNTSRHSDANANDANADVSHTSRHNDASASRHSDGNESDDSGEVVFVSDERMQGYVHLDDSYEGKTDEEDRGSEGERVRMSSSALLPPLFAGRTFAVAESAERYCSRARLEQYARAYGALVLDEADLDPENTESYVLCTDREPNLAPGALRVRPDWLWHCHLDKRLHPLDDYLIT